MRTKSASLLGCLLWLEFQAMLLGPAVRGAGSLQPLYLRCQASCAEVLVAGRHAGAAWFADTEGAAITAAHLFERRDPTVELLLADNRRLPARLVAVDCGHDVALLQIQGTPGPLKPLPCARREPAVGDEIYQFGAPLFRSELLQPGRVAATAPKFEFHEEVVDYAEVLPVAAMLQGGTSGSPWLNRHGQVVGVQSSVMSLDGKPIGVAFFASTPTVRRLLQERRDARTPTLGVGVDELWQQASEFLARLPSDTRGLVVGRVRAEGPAAHAGIVPQDVLISADGHPLVRIAELLRVVRQHAPGDRFALTLLRPGETNPRRVSVTLGCAEEIWGAEAPSETPPQGRP